MNARSARPHRRNCAGDGGSGKYVLEITKTLLANLANMANLANLDAPPPCASSQHQRPTWPYRLANLANKANLALLANLAPET